MKASIAIYFLKMSGFAPIKLYLQNKNEGWIWLTGQSLPSLIKNKCLVGL